VRVCVTILVRRPVQIRRRTGSANQSHGNNACGRYWPIAGRPAARQQVGMGSNFHLRVACRRRRRRRPPPITMTASAAVSASSRHRRWPPLELGRVASLGRESQSTSVVAGLFAFCALPLARRGLPGRLTGRARSVCSPPIHTDPSFSHTNRILQTESRSSNKQTRSTTQPPSPFVIFANAIKRKPNLKNSAETRNPFSFVRKIPKISLHFVASSPPLDAGRPMKTTHHQPSPGAPETIANKN
jgi:hypothetical protein